MKLFGYLSVLVGALLGIVIGPLLLVVMLSALLIVAPMHLLFVAVHSFGHRCELPKIAVAAQVCRAVVTQPVLDLILRVCTAVQYTAETGKFKW